MSRRTRSSFLTLVALLLAGVALPAPAAVASERLTVVIAPPQDRPVHDAPFTVAAPTWTAEPDVVTYRWSRYAGDDLVPLDVSGPTYTPTADTIGESLLIEVTAHKEGYDDGYSSIVTTAVLPGAFASAPVVAVLGEPRVGVPMTATVTGAPSPAPDRYSYAWWIQDPGPTGSDPDVIELLPGSSGFTQTLTPGPELVGRRLAVQVTAHRDHYATVETTTLVGFVEPGRFAAAPVVRVRGVARVGSTLTAAATTPAGTTSERYQWLRGTTPVAGATGRSYRLGAADLGRRITVRVTVGAVGYAPATGASPATAPVRLGAARLRVGVPAQVVAGRRATITVRGLAGGERFTVTLAGRPTTGRANGAGVGTVRVKVVGRPGTRTVEAVGSSPDRRGSATLRVRR